MNNLIKYIFVCEKSGKKIGFFRVFFSVFFGFSLANLILAFFVLVFKVENFLFPLMISSLIWVCFTFYLSLSYSKFTLLLKAFFTNSLLLVLIFIFG